MSRRLESCTIRTVLTVNFGLCKSGYVASGQRYLGLSSALPFRQILHCYRCNEVQRDLEAIITIHAVNTLFVWRTSALRAPVTVKSWIEENLSEKGPHKIIAYDQYDIYIYIYISLNRYATSEKTSGKKNFRDEGTV